MGSGGRDGGEDGHGGVLREVEGAEGFESGGFDERHIAREDEEVFGGRLAGGGEVCLELLEGVAGAALLSLQDEGDAGGGDGGANLIGLVTDDAVDLVGGRDGFGGGDDVEKGGTGRRSREGLWGGGS